MHVVQPQYASQSIRKEGVNNLIELLEFVQTEWDRFMNSKRRTMRDLVIPGHITHLVINGEIYEIGGRRALWFERLDRGYCQDRFYVSEGTDMNGHPYQLHLDRSQGNMYDDVVLVLARRLGVPQVKRTFSSTGPSVRD